MVRHSCPDCRYCGRPTQRRNPKAGDYLTRDHVLARAFGGQVTVPCCLFCNQVKGSGDAALFVAFVNAGMLKRSRGIRGNAIAFEGWIAAHLF